jgi:Membrane bound beta barrel domain (DUF5777)
MKKYFFFLLLLVLCRPASAQEDLLSLLGDDAPENEKVINSFKATRVINGHSIESLSSGVLDFKIMHRFGRISGGAYQLWGLDQATIRLGLDYGITDRLTIGIGRSTYKKEVDGFIKYKLLWQSTGKKAIPLSVILVSGMTMNTLKFKNPERTNYFTSRLGYYYQVIAGRKFSERFSLQFSPTMVHRNLVERIGDPSDVYALGIGTRFKITKRIALTGDYFYVVNTSVSENFINPLSLGFDIETGGHVFQLHFTNATGMNERAFITETNGEWSNGDIQLGFNISRVFTIVDRRKNKK